MANPAILDLNTLVQAGIDPKTGLPLKVSNDLACGLKDNVLAQLSIVDRQDAINRYVWFNLPEGLNSELIERILYYKGQGALFYMESDQKFYFLPYALDGTIDVYGRFMGITPLPFTGSTSNSKEDKVKPWITGLTKKPRYEVSLPEELTPEYILDSCVLLSDYSKGLAQTITPRSSINSPLLGVMAECIPFMRTALQNSTGVEGMKVDNEDEQSNVKTASLAIQRAALNGEKWIPIIGKMEFQQLTATPTAKSEEFLLTMQGLDNYRLSLYGMDNGGLFQKRSHMLEAEQRMNSTNSGIIMQDGLKNRLDFCNIVNSIYGTAITCEINETLTNVDTNLDGVLGPAPIPQTKEEVKEEGEETNE